MNFTKAGELWKNSHGDFIETIRCETGELFLSNGDVYGFYNEKFEPLFTFMGLCKTKPFKGCSMLVDVRFNADLSTVINQLTCGRIYNITKLQYNFATLVTFLYTEARITLFSYPFIVYRDDKMQIIESIPVERFTFKKKSV